MTTFHCGTIALLGRPNVGKSTLMNKIIGSHVAIVTPKPQTTRHRILGIRTTEHSQMIFVDTPGIHKGNRQLNKNMVRIAYSAAEEADVLAIMQDASRPLDSITSRLIARFAENNLSQPRIHVLNKVDKMDKSLLLPRLEAIQQLDDTAKAFIPLSAKKGSQVDGFLRELQQYLPAAEPHYDADWYTDQSQRQLAAEYVREQIFLSMHQEIPFQTAVDVEVFEETAKGLHIEAVILVGSEGHKPMLIGKHGEQIKRMGTVARKGLQNLLNQHIDLRLWVKVDAGWFDHPIKLQDLGLGMGIE